MSPQAQNKVNRDLVFKKRFDHLYNVERKRVDDVWNCLSQEFFVDKITLQRRLRSLDERMSVNVSNQISMF
jgi:hypothetical protein